METIFFCWLFSKTGAQKIVQQFINEGGSMSNVINCRIIQTYKKIYNEIKDQIRSF